MAIAVVTGASGHLGRTLVYALVKKGYTVRVLLRDPAACTFEDIPVAVEKGDLDNSDALVRAFAGADVVLHAAAFISIMPGDEKKLLHTNVTGTENVVNACVKAKAKRLVYTSSIEAIGIVPHGTVITEEIGFHPDNVHLPYARTKAIASERVLAAVDEGLDAVIVSPTAIIGPDDVKPSQIGSMIRDVVRRRLIGYPEGAFDFVDVRDAAEAHILAAQRGRCGAHYLASGSRHTLDGLMRMIASAAGMNAPPIFLPHRLAVLIAHAAEVYYAVSKTMPVFTVKAMEILMTNSVISHEKATRELGYDPRPIEETIRDTVRYFQEKDAAGR